MSFKARVAADVWRGNIEFAITERTLERVVGEMPVIEGALNPFGTVHAGAMIWFADVVATQCAIGDFEREVVAIAVEELVERRLVDVGVLGDAVDALARLVQVRRHDGQAERAATGQGVGAAVLEDRAALPGELGVVEEGHGPPARDEPPARR